MSAAACARKASALCFSAGCTLRERERVSAGDMACFAIEGAFSDDGWVVLEEVREAMLNVWQEQCFELRVKCKSSRDVVVSILKL